MTVPLTDWRIARSFIGALGAAESSELQFNIGTQEAIEIASISGRLAFGTITSAATIVPRLAQQSLHLEDGAITVPDLDETDADVFDSDAEIIFEQFLNGIAFDGTTEGGAAIDGVNIEKVFRRPFISPINPTHSVVNEGSVSAVSALLLIEYRFVKLDIRELAFQFSRRRR